MLENFPGVPHPTSSPNLYNDVSNLLGKSVYDLRTNSIKNMQTVRFTICFLRHIIYYRVRRVIRRAIKSLYCYYYYLCTHDFNTDRYFGDSPAFYFTYSNNHYPYNTPHTPYVGRAIAVYFIVVLVPCTHAAYTRRRFGNIDPIEYRHFTRTAGETSLEIRRTAGFFVLHKMGGVLIFFLNTTCVGG